MNVAVDAAVDVGSNVAAAAALLRPQSTPTSRRRRRLDCSRLVRVRSGIKSSRTSHSHTQFESSVQVVRSQVLFKCSNARLPPLSDSVTFRRQQQQQQQNALRKYTNHTHRNANRRDNEEIFSCVCGIIRSRYVLLDSYMMIYTKS